MKKKLGFLENLTYYLGLIVSAFGIYKIYQVRKGLPQAMCPIETNRQYLILGVILLVISIILGLIKQRDK